MLIFQENKTWNGMDTNNKTPRIDYVVNVKYKIRRNKSFIFILSFKISPKVGATQRGERVWTQDVTNRALLKSKKQFKFKLIKAEKESKSTKGK